MWFAVSLLFKSNAGPQAGADNLWEESIVLVKADTDEEARRAGERLGKANEHSYLSATGANVCWTFERIDAVYEILGETIEHGTEVYSRFLKSSEVESLLTPFAD